MALTFNRSEGSNVEDSEAVMQFYDKDGGRTKKGSGDAVVQYLSNDPNRPDAAKSVKAPPEDKAVKSPPADKAADETVKTVKTV